MKLTCSLLLVLIFSSKLGSLHAEGVSPEICQKTLDLLFQYHQSLTKKEYENQSDQYSEFAFLHILKKIDPNRIYLSETDIALWQTQGLHRSLDEAMDTCDTGLVAQFVAMVKQRQSESIRIIESFQNETDADVERVSKVSLSSWDRGFEGDETNRLTRLKELTRFLIIGEMTDGSEFNTAKERVRNSIEEDIAGYESLDESDLVSLLIEGMVAKLDPHTRYFNPEQYRSLKENIAGEVVGIGILTDFKGGKCVVLELITGGPADLQGQLEAGDEILAIGLPGHEFKSLANMGQVQISALLRGEIGSPVVLRVLKKDRTEIQEITVHRGVVETPESMPTAYTINLAGDEAESTKAKPVKKIAVVRIPEFSEGIALKVARLLVEVLGIDPHTGTSEEIDVVVVDLRGNGGGLFNEAIALTGLFITSGPVVQLKKNGNELPEVFYDNDGGNILWKGPLVVATDHGSASASEIFAGAIKDHKRGIIVGEETTFGKGSVQKVLPLCDSDKISNSGSNSNKEKLGGLKTTICMFYRINGISTQHLGVESDVVIPSPLTVARKLESSLSSSLPPQSLEPVEGLDDLVASNQQVSDDLLATIQTSMAYLSEYKLATDKDYKNYQESLREYKKISSELEIQYSLSLLKEREIRKSDLKKNLEIDPESMIKRADIKSVFIDESTRGILTVAALFRNLTLKQKNAIASESIASE